MLHQREAEQLNATNQEHLTNYTAILLALLDNGTITEEQYQRARAKAATYANQVFSQGKSAKSGVLRSLFGA